MSPDFSEMIFLGPVSGFGAAAWAGGARTAANVNAAAVAVILDRNVLMLSSLRPRPVRAGN